MMRDHRPKLAKDLVDQSGLSHFTHHVTDILQIQQALQKLLPHHLAIHYRVANLRSNQLLIEVANASLQVKLNYDRLRLLSELRRLGFAKLAGIELKVNPELYKAPKIEQPKSDYHPSQVLSQNTANTFLMLSEVTSNEKLKLRLQKLAKLTQKNR